MGSLDRDCHCLIPITGKDKVTIMRINGLIVAAGISSRMGGFKPILPLRGKTIIENSIDSMLVAGVSKIVLVTGYHSEELERIVNDRYIGDTVICIRNPLYASTDMLTSIKVGLQVMPDCDAFYLLPGDMPVIQKDTYLAVYKKMIESEKDIVFPELDGTRKHPPLIRFTFQNEIMKYRGQGGLRELWKYHENDIVGVSVDDIGCWTDLDTYEQYIQCINQYINKW